MNYCWKITKDLNNFTKVCVDETGKTVDSANCQNCDECQELHNLVKEECRIAKIGYDNGITPGSSSNDCGSRPNFVRFSWDMEVVSWEVNGQLVGAGHQFTGITGWTPQLQAWANFFNEFNPNSAPCALAEFGFKPAPTWRYAEITDCNSRSVYGPLILKRLDDGCIFTIYPVIKEATFEKLKRYEEYNCKTDAFETKYLNMDNKETKPSCCPECYVPCGHKFEDFTTGASECVSQTFSLCGFDDPDNPIPIIRVITDCGSVRTRETYTEDSYLNAQSPDDLIEYTGEVKNCDGTDFDEPVVPNEIPTVTGISEVCFEKVTAGEPIKLGSDASDCDPGQGNVGDTLCGDFQVYLDGTPLSHVSAVTDNPDVTITFDSIVNNVANYKYCWVTDGNNNPAGNITVEMVTDKGNVVWNTADNPDFKLCSGGGGSYLGTTKSGVEKLTLKRICKEGLPDVYQNSLGEIVDVSELTECEKFPTTTCAGEEVLATKECNSSSILETLQALLNRPDHAPQTFYKMIPGEIGTVEQKWTGDNVGPASTAAGSSYKEAFSLTDAEGYPAHPNLPDAVVVSNNIASTTNVGGTLLDDQAKSDLWIILEQDTELREFNATAEAAGVWIASECGSYDMEEVVDAGYTNSGPNPFGTWKKGYYRVRLYHSDATANGVSKIQGLINGTWTNLTAYKTPPTFEIIKGWYCSDGNNYNQDRSVALDETWLCEDPRCTPSNCCGGGSETTLPQTLRII